ncbi:coenzyme A transporter [Savitreella phatthalungensis]
MHTGEKVPADVVKPTQRSDGRHLQGYGCPPRATLRVENAFLISSPEASGTLSRIRAALSTWVCVGSPLPATHSAFNMGRVAPASAPLCETDANDLLSVQPLPAKSSPESSPLSRAAPVCETDEAIKTDSQRRIPDRRSLDYIMRSGFAGGVAGCAAKSLIAPLDRVKILFQTSNPEYAHYAKRRFGVWHAASDIYTHTGILGLFKGHLATLLRIFPYAGIKFVAYEQYRALLITDAEDEVPWRRFAAGSMAGLTSVFFTYPLEVVRVRLAFETRKTETSIRKICRDIYWGRLGGSHSAGGSVANFYRGFSPTLAGMLPYAGVSFLTHDSIGDLMRDKRVAAWTTYSSSDDQPRAQLVAWAELTAGGLAGMLSQTASYPLEVVRRRMQVSGAVGNGARQGFWHTAADIWTAHGARGFFVGLTIGYIKVVPMVACSFYVYERMKHVLGI